MECPECKLWIIRELAPPMLEAIREAVSFGTGVIKGDT